MRSFYQLDVGRYMNASPTSARRKHVVIKLLKYISRLYISVAAACSVLLLYKHCFECSVCFCETFSLATCPERWTPGSFSEETVDSPWRPAVAFCRDSPGHIQQELCSPQKKVWSPQLVTAVAGSAAQHHRPRVSGPRLPTPVWTARTPVGRPSWHPSRTL